MIRYGEMSKHLSITFYKKLTKKMGILTFSKRIMPIYVRVWVHIYMYHVMSLLVEIKTCLDMYSVLYKVLFEAVYCQLPA